MEGQTHRANERQKKQRIDRHTEDRMDEGKTVIERECKTGMEKEGLIHRGNERQKKGKERQTRRRNERQKEEGGTDT